MRQLFSLLITLLAAARIAMAQDASTSVSLRELPVAVQKTIHEQLGSAKLGEIERNTEDGEVTFTVTITKGGEEREFTVGEDGKLLSVQVDLEEAPPAVQRVIKAQMGAGALESVEKKFED